MIEKISGIHQWNYWKSIKEGGIHCRYWNISIVISGIIFIPIMENKIEQSSTYADSFFYLGWLGGYFTRTMMPKNGEVRYKMKAMKNHSPDPDLNGEVVIREFLQWQRKLMLLIRRAEKVNLNSIKIPLFIAPLSV
jgi:hypothetical protein